MGGRAGKAAGALGIVEGYFERLALRVLMRNGKRAFVLAPSDNALLIRDSNLLPIFATDDASQEAALGAVWVAALHRVANHPGGTLGMADAVTLALHSAGVAEEMVRGVQENFAQLGREAKEAALRAIQGQQGIAQ